MVEATDKKGNVYSYPSTYAACRGLGMHRSTLRACIKRGHGCYGFFSGWIFRQTKPSPNVRVIVIATDADGVEHRFQGYKGAAHFFECSVATIGKKLKGRDVPMLRGWSFAREVA